MVNMGDGVRPFANGLAGPSPCADSKLPCRLSVGLTAEPGLIEDLRDGGARADRDGGVRLVGEPRRGARGEVTSPLGFAGLAARGEEAAVRPGEEGAVRPGEEGAVRPGEAGASRAEGTRARPVLPVLACPRPGRVTDGYGSSIRNSMKTVVPRRTRFNTRAVNFNR